MIASANETIAMAMALPLLVGATHITHSMHRRIRTYAKSRCIARIVSMIVAAEDPTDSEISSLRTRYTSKILLDAVAFISEYLYGRALSRLSLIAEVCRVDYSPLCRTRLRDIATFVETYPYQAIRHLARLDTLLSWHDVAVLVRLMRRAGVPIAYTPLLSSQSRNLQMIGIYLCEHFLIVDAEPLLQQLCRSEDGEVARAALYTLCSIRGDMATTQVEQAVTHLSLRERDAFLRHLVHSCYSLRSCAHLLNSEEQMRFTQRQNSYKCQIVCN